MSESEQTPEVSRRLIRGLPTTGNVSDDEQAARSKDLFSKSGSGSFGAEESEPKGRSGWLYPSTSSVDSNPVSEMSESSSENVRASTFTADTVIAIRTIASRMRKRGMM